jgi:hypothetical protein
MERKLQVFRAGDRKLLLGDLLWDHRSRSAEQAEAALEALLDLPFNREIAERLQRVD